ncbi:hypothetical protein FV139_05055 [Parahaliea maris]|uniref:DUF4426 domain-containing protein n=1 Tax=Parahaliea maris TaxID=2716870 RepID=A0A5C9A3C9_9GAMM|nr:hypothetical protein FV139_05055 [Parahaliea maris]
MAIRFRYLGLSVLAATLGAQGVLAETVTKQTDWMELVKGYKGKQMGAELRDIESEDTFGGRKITIAIPKTSMSDPGMMEEVRVVGHRPEETEFEFPLEFRHEWVDDYDNDYYGLVLYLGKDANVPIRLYMESNTGFAR